MKKLAAIAGIIMISSSLNISFGQNTGTNTASTNISPIVQVISYKNIFGKYVQMLGWGSASIINTGGVIITNNHVVDDGKGNVAGVFSICMTKKEKEKPSCDYTATLIDRDEDKDIAMLKIDSKDIYGNDVNYSNFKTIDVDFDYIPQTQDEVVAIGYPWIGSDTITETKGIISGISKYNDNNYIKTDTIIAGGNSGGGLIRNNKLIGIPTFGIGGSSDPSLGYALSIPEAKEFIQKNINTVPETKKSEIDFNSYKSTIDKINSDMKVQDDIFDINFGSDYEILNYIKNQRVELKPRQAKEIIVQGLSISLTQIPSISNEKDFLYFLESRGFYYKQLQKLRKVQIGGLIFYTPVFIDDKSQGQADYYKTYIAQIGNDKIIQINANLGNVDEKNSDKLQQQLQLVLNKINFQKDFSKISFGFSLNSPKINITNNSGLSMNEYAGGVYKYLGNLHEYFDMEVSLKDLYSGKGKTNDEIYSTETTNISEDMKSKFNYKGYKGYIYCQETISSYAISVDEKGNPLNQSQCNISITEGLTGINNEEYEIDMTLVADKKNIEKHLDTVINFLNNDISLEKVGDGTTTITNILKNQISLLFGDIQNQTKGFKNKLKLLVKYGLLDNTTQFDPYKPLQRGEFLYMYFKSVYGYDLTDAENSCMPKDYECIFENYDIDINGGTQTLMDITNQLGVNLKGYVNADKSNADKLKDFALFIEMKLAGVIKADLNGGNFSEEFFNNFVYLKDEEIFAGINTKMKEFYFSVFGNRKILITETGKSISDFVPTKEIRYSASKGILSKNIFSTGSYQFGYSTDNDTKAINDQYGKCLKMNTFKKMSTCLFNLDQKYKDDSYPVLTKAAAIDFIVDNMDFGLFDEDLAKKKDTMIEEENNN